MDEKLPIKSDQPQDDERNWKDVAARWKEVSKQMLDLGDRLGSAFKEGWATDEVAEEEERRMKEKLKQLGLRMDKAIDSMREEAKTPETKAAAKETWGATRKASTELMGELQESVSEGLKEINKRVDDLMQKRKEKKEQKEK
jgi:hypothetical protein